MANMELIGGPTGGQISSPTSSITFSNIPQTYTDLKIVYSVRSSVIYNEVHFRFNGSSSGYSALILNGNGTTTTSYTEGSTEIHGALSIPSGYTSSTFASGEIYIPNYTASVYKSVSIDSVQENNATLANAQLVAALWSNTTAITSINFFPATETGTLVAGSTFYLYGISNVTSGSKATGGIVSSDGTYWYHMFPYSGTFTPTTAISADVLCIAGGGSGGTFSGGGGGAGGLVYSASQSLTATAYTATIGSGGAISTGGAGFQGTNSNLTGGALSLTAAVGGGGGAGYNGGPYYDGTTGGSGGGGIGQGTGTTQNGKTGTSGQGNTGGDGGVQYSGGGGGGAGAAGQTVVTNVKAGDGGVGVNTYLTFANATQTGVNNGYYAGGGGGGPYIAGGMAIGIGGLGGGGSSSTGAGNAGVINTGGGGGGSAIGSYVSGAGGSGLVIIRYAI
jgi:hypothetical protein